MTQHLISTEGAGGVRWKRTAGTIGLMLLVSIGASVLSLVVGHAERIDDFANFFVGVLFAYRHHPDLPTPPAGEQA